MLFRKSMIYPLELQFTAKFFGTRIFRRLHFLDQYGIINASVYYMVTSKNPQKLRQIEAFSIIGQILTCKQCFEKVTLP